jgi:hypothetical protein
MNRVKTLFYDELSEDQAKAVPKILEETKDHPLFYPPPYTYRYAVNETGNVVGASPALGGRQTLVLHDIELDRVVGYRRSARFIGVYWEPGGDELTYADGACALCGANYIEFLHIARHYELWEYEIGDSDNEAKNWIIYDRVDKTYFIVPVDDAKHFLRGQWRDRELEQLPHEIERLLREMKYDSGKFVKSMDVLGKGDGGESE